MNKLRKEKSSLLDTEGSLVNLLFSTNCLFIRKIYERFGTEPIFDKDNNTILKIDHYSHSANGNYQLIVDANNKFYLREKEWSFSKVHFLRNGHGKIAKMQKKVFSFSPYFYLRTMNGKKLLETEKNSFNRENFQILNLSNNKPACRVKFIKSRLGKNTELRKYLKVEFLDSDVPKILALSFILFIRKLTMGYNGISDVASYGRTIARLRPFGPKSFR